MDKAEYTADKTAPATGTYELRSPSSGSTIVRVPVFQGAAFPPAPPGWAWRLAAPNLPPD